MQQSIDTCTRKKFFSRTLPLAYSEIIIADKPKQYGRILTSTENINFLQEKQEKKQKGKKKESNKEKNERN